VGRCWELAGWGLVKRGVHPSLGYFERGGGGTLRSAGGNCGEVEREKKEALFEKVGASIFKK